MASLTKLSLWNGTAIMHFNSRSRAGMKRACRQSPSELDSTLMHLQPCGGVVANSTPWRQEARFLRRHAARLHAKPLLAIASLCRSISNFRRRLICRILARSFPKLSAPSLLLQDKAAMTSVFVFSRTPADVNSCQAAAYSGQTHNT